MSRFTYDDAGNVVDHEPTRGGTETFEQIRDKSRRLDRETGVLFALVAAFGVLFALGKMIWNSL